MSAMPPCNEGPTDCPDTSGSRAFSLRRPDLGPGCSGWLRVKGWRVVLPFVAVLLAACAGTRVEPLPRMTASAPGLADDRCVAFFPQGRWQMIHAIDFHMADGTNGNALGVLILDGRSLSSALMTVEGLTLFEARSLGDGSLEVLRALPPFNGQAFAAGLIADVRTLFQPPAGIASVGRLADGRALCRYTVDQAVTDVLPEEDGCFQLFTYASTSASGGNISVRTRTVEARTCRITGGSLLPHDVRLTGHGPSGYTLNLRLLSAEPLPASTP